MIAKIHRTDLIISCHSREGKKPFYCRINMLEMGHGRVVRVAWLWLRKSLVKCEFEAGLLPAATGKLCL